MQIHKICRKLKQKYKFKYNINAIFSDLIYARILDPCSKLSSYKVASEFLEKPSYEQQKIKKRRKRVGIKHKKTTATPDHYLLPQVCPVSEINPQEQGFIPLYKREAITDVLHEVSGFRTDYQFIL